MKRYLKIIKTISFLVLTAAVLTGCQTTPVTVKSDPDHSDFYSNGKSLGQTPYHAEFNLFASRLDGELRKEGYVPKNIAVTPANAPEVTFTLERPKVTLTSVPIGADVFTPTGERIGQTPIVITISNAAQPYQLHLQCYDPKTATLTFSSAKTIEVNMGTVFPGCELPVTTFVNGRPVIGSTTVFSDRDVIERSPSVRAVRKLTDFPATRVVGSGTLSPDGKRLMMNVYEQVAAARYSSLWSIGVEQGAV